MIALEARRRDPSIRMNGNKRSNQEMMAELTLLGHLLMQEDREFVIRKECEMRASLLGQLTLMSDPTAVRQVCTSAAHLRLAAAIGLKNNLLLFKRSQDCSTRLELDRGTSLKGILMEALAATFNDKNWVAEIQAMPELQDDFQEAIKIGHMRNKQRPRYNKPGTSISFFKGFHQRNNNLKLTPGHPMYTSRKRPSASQTASIFNPNLPFLPLKNFAGPTLNSFRKSSEGL
jgi:hypothetical protein